MRVLFWSERFWPTIGGVGLSAGKLLPALRARGYDFVVVTSREYSDLPEEDDYKGIRVYRLPLWTSVAHSDVNQIMELKRRIVKLKQAFRPDLVHINFVGPSVLFHFQTLDAHPSPLLVSNDSPLPEHDITGHSLAGRAIRSADWVTCVSKASLAKVRELVPELVSRSSFIYKGLEVPSLKPATLPIEPPGVLCLGRLVRNKGFDLAVTAFASLVARFPKARLVIAGDGTERLKLEQQVAGLGLQTAVDMVGWVRPDDVPALMNTASLVVIPSRNDGLEGLPNVAKEAGLMARPVVATRVGGLPEVIAHKQTGLLVEPEDSSALAEAMAFLLGHPEEFTRMGQAARLHVQNLFSWERYLDAYDALYQKLTLSSRHSKSRCNT